MEFTFETSELSVDVFRDLSEKCPEQVLEVKGKGLLGDTGVVDFIVQITPYVITALTSIFVTRLQNKSNTSVSIKLNGKELELKNIKVSEETIKSFIEQVMRETGETNE